MSEQETAWRSFDGLEYYAWSASPMGPPRAVIALVHGMGEHSRRYHNWARLLTQYDYAFVSMDYRGHGRSEGKKGHTPSYEALMYDVKLLTARSKELFHGIPLVLYGHSLGGNLVLNFHLLHPEEADLLVVTSPWLKLTFELPGVIKKAGRLMRCLIPSMVQKSKLETQALSRDIDIVHTYENDPLVHDRISLNMLFHVMDRGLAAIGQAGRIRVPVLLMHGEEDRITSCEASRELAGKNAEYIHLKTWPGCFHELHNEPCRDEVFHYLTEWLDKNLPPK